MKKEIKEKIEQLREESRNKFKDLLKERNGFPLVIVYGTGEGRELTLNVAHIDFLNEIPGVRNKIVERIKIWADGQNPQYKMNLEEKAVDTVDIEDIKDTFSRN